MYALSSVVYALQSRSGATQHRLLCGGCSCCCKFFIIFSCCLLGWIAASKDVVYQECKHGETEGRHDGVGDCSNASFHKVPEAPCKGSSYAYTGHTLAMDADNV